MTDMDEIRNLLDEYVSWHDEWCPQHDAKCNTVHRAKEDAARSALLQRVEALREAMYEARAALWALSRAWRLRVAGYSTDLGTPHGTEAMVYRRCAAELDAALTPSPPETPAPSPVESPGEERPRADLAEIERLVSKYGRAIVYGGNGLKALEARATLLSAIRSLRAPREVEEALSASRDVYSMLMLQHPDEDVIANSGGERHTDVELDEYGWRVVDALGSVLARLSSPSGEARTPDDRLAYGDDDARATVLRARDAAMAAEAAGEAPERGDGEVREVLRRLQCGACGWTIGNPTTRPTSCEDCANARRLFARLDARPSPRGTGTEAVERVCPACGETPSAARERWAKIAARPDFDPEGAPTPCDHAALRRGTGTEGGK